MNALITDLPILSCFVARLRKKMSWRRKWRGMRGDEEKDRNGGERQKWRRKTEMEEKDRNAADGLSHGISNWA